MAKDEAAARLGRIEKLLDVLEELREKEDAVIEELGELAAGGAGIAGIWKDAMNVFHHAWGRKYGGSYVWQHTKDVPQLKRLAKALGHEELIARIGRYFVNADPFFVTKRHPFGLFVATINQHVAESQAGAFHFDEAPGQVIGCSHDPRCGNDQQHTKKRNEEMRAAF
jgi:hypothetical protein